MIHFFFLVLYIHDRALKMIICPLINRFNCDAVPSVFEMDLNPTRNCPKIKWINRDFFYLYSTVDPLDFRTIPSHIHVYNSKMNENASELEQFWVFEKWIKNDF